MIPEDFQKYLQDGGQILKTRDDQALVYLVRNRDKEDTNKRLELMDSVTCS